MATPLVSVILPVYNAATTVARAVEGIRGSRGARESVRASLGARGYVEGRDFLRCA